LVLLPIEADENIDALKHYYGIIRRGELVVRGIKIRRHDIPNIIKYFQTESLYTLFNCKDTIAEVVSKGYENCLLSASNFSLGLKIPCDTLMSSRQMHLLDDNVLS
jgi:DNA polymerase elongation subunit (family B)